MEHQSQGEKKQRDYFLPGSIVLAALLIGGALVYSVGKNSIGTDAVPSDNIGNPLLSLSKVTGNDHIVGEIDAPIRVVLFSDTECPFCKDFHFVMKKIVATYGDKVAWVYRHAPLDQLHAKARKEAEATECAADLGGNKKFWEYIDRLMEVTPSNDGLDLGELPKIAEYVGLNKTKFSECLSSGKFSSKVERNLQEAIIVGMQGTPYSVIVMNGVPQYALPGSVSYEEMKLVFDELLKEL